MAESIPNPTHKLVAIRNGIPYQTLYVAADDADDLDNAVAGFCFAADADSVATRELDTDEAASIGNDARAMAQAGREE